MHDFLGAYNRFQNCRHNFCNAHLQRELVYVHEELKQKWAGDMIDLLLEAKELADRQAARPEGSRNIIGEQTIYQIMMKYSDILIAGDAINPEPPPPLPGKRGRIKRSQELNLLNRFDKNAEEIMGFFVNEAIPYDNNQAERDLRMMKVREKISGTFRNVEYGEAYCRLRGIISSARKQSRGMLESLGQLLTNPLALGRKLAEGQVT